VLDVQLPGMSGLDLQRHLAAVGLRIPTIVVTARYDAGGSIRRQAMSQGASAFLPKPFGGGDLLAAVRAAFAPAD
jgi:FixJ family two-component response regulator